MMVNSIYFEISNLNGTVMIIFYSFYRIEQDFGNEVL